MRKSASLLSLLLSLVCCSKAPDDFIVPGVQVTDQKELGHEMIVLGEQLEDPYSVENMTKALQSLYPTKASEIVLKATDLYVRFLPLSDEQFDRLVDMGVEMLDHPVDYQIIKEGDYYHDPTIDEDQITWQYAVVDKSFQFPKDIRYELLDKVYLSEHQVLTRATEGIDWDAVEREAFRITGNGDAFPETKGSKQTPSGRIAIMDEDYDSEPIGVSGVRVSCNVFVKFAHTYTDEEGYYEMGKSFSHNPRYRLVFKNKKGFGIGFNLLLVPASFSTLGSDSPEGVSVVIDRSCNRTLYTRCVVNNAAYDYFCNCEKDGAKIKTPPSNLRIWIFKNLRASSAVMLQQGAGIDNTVVGEFLGIYASILKIFLPDITLGLSGCDDYASIYASAVHELAHASHYMSVGNDYWLSLMTYVLKSFITSGGITYGVGTESGHGYCEVGEMWAYYVQTRMFRDRYPDSAKSFGTSFWFYPQVLFYLDEKGLNRFKLFAAFTPDVTDRDLLQEKLLNLYPEQKTVITQAFQRYQ